MTHFSYKLLLLTFLRDGKKLSGRRKTQAYRIKKQTINKGPSLAEKKTKVSADSLRDTAPSEESKVKDSVKAIRKTPKPKNIFLTPAQLIAYVTIPST